MLCDNDELYLNPCGFIRGQPEFKIYISESHFQN